MSTVSAAATGVFVNVGTVQSSAQSDPSSLTAQSGSGGTASAASSSSGGSSVSISSSSSSSTTIASETSVQNPDGSITTTIVYEDGTTKETTTAPDPSKASTAFLAEHSAFDKSSEGKDQKNIVSVSLKA
jgi:hypothetical protein